VIEKKELSFDELWNYPKRSVNVYNSEDSNKLIRVPVHRPDWFILPSQGPVLVDKFPNDTYF